MMVVVLLLDATGTEAASLLKCPGLRTRQHRGGPCVWPWLWEAGRGGPEGFPGSESRGEARGVVERVGMSKKKPHSPALRRGGGAEGRAAPPGVSFSCVGKPESERETERWRV